MIASVIDSKGFHLDHVVIRISKSREIFSPRFFVLESVCGEERVLIDQSIILFVNKQKVIDLKSLVLI